MEYEAEKINLVVFIRNFQTVFNVPRFGIGDPIGRLWNKQFPKWMKFIPMVPSTQKENSQHRNLHKMVSIW